MSVMFQNENGFVQNLGMRGEYPYSSSVGRLYTLNGVTKEKWYSTEINPSGETLLEYHTKNFINALKGETHIDVNHTLKRLGFIE